MTFNTKRILIETESHEVFVIHANGTSKLRGFCARCAVEQELLTLDESVAFSRTGALKLIDCIRSGVIHFLETSGGHLLVCRDSLEKWSAAGAPVTPREEIKS